ncbi:hypothetical protein [Succinimonas sp.]|uniref:hypothetical protein n=1 Tax=Succinimonas sp. TaxID=1936151 RepID=UPI0038692A88
MTELTLKDFNAIASGSYNAGIVDYRENANHELKLIKLNNHVFRTSKNNKTLSPERILDIKEKFITALQKGGVSNDALNEIRDEIGIPRSLTAESADKNQKGLQSRFLPLTRHAIRTILDKYANKGIGFGDYAQTVHLTEKEVKAAENAAKMSKSKADTRQSINYATLGKHYQAKEYSVLNAVSLLSPHRNICETVKTTAKAHISINPDDNNTNYVKDNTAKIKNQYLNMCKIALKMTTSNITESETFRLCDEEVKLVKDGQGKLSAFIGKEPNAIKINMDIDPRKMLMDLFREAVKSRDVIGKGDVRMFLDGVFENDLNGSLTGNDRTSLSRQFATIICEQISRDDFSEVMEGDYNTLFLLDVARYTLAGNAITKEQMMNYLEKIAKDNSGLSDEMKDMLRQSANIPFEQRDDNGFYVDANMITESVNKVAEENVPKPKKHKKAERITAAEKESLSKLQFADKAVINDLLKNPQTLRSFVVSDQNIGLFGKLLSNNTYPLKVMNNGKNLENKYPEQYKKLLTDIEQASRKYDDLFIQATGFKLSASLKDPDFNSKFTAFINGLSEADLAPVNSIIKDISAINDYQIKDFIADLVFSDDTMVAEALQSNPGEAMRQMLTAPERINVFASIVKNPEVLNTISDAVTTEVVKQNFAEIRKIIADAYQKAEGKSLDEAAKAPDFAENLKAFISNPDKMPSSELYKFGFIIQKMANKGCEHIQKFINQVFKADNKAVNDQGGITTDPYKNMSAQDIKRELDGKTLKDIANSAATDATSPGQLALFKQVLGDYFVNMTLADKKSSFAAALRFSQTFDFHDIKGEPLQGKTFESARNNAEVKFAGAILKGTSPLMQKMLQGLPRSVVGEFADALDDMKSKLAPIPRKIVQAYLTKMINDSKNTDHPIQSIELEESVGAASVGEAFICRFKYKKAGSDEVITERKIVKIMRHDAEERVRKEAEVFTAAAQKIGNFMAKTWQGQLNQYMKEFDFRNEAKNIKEGVKIYDIRDNPNHPSYAIGSNVTSMKLADDLVPPQKNILVGSLGSGSTVDYTIKKSVKGLYSDASFIFETDPSTGKIILNKDSQNKPVPIPKKGVSITALGTCASNVIANIERLKSYEEQLLQAAQVWFSEGFLGSGKFHGDFHAGNIMTTDSSSTFIDFGNLYEFKKIYEKDKDGNVITETVSVKDEDGNVTGTEERPKVIFDERIEMLRLILGCALRNGDAFVTGFEHLLPPDGKKIFQASKAKVNAIVNSIMTKGDIAHDVVTRLQCILSELQKLGLEVPPQIYCFVQSMNRLQNTINEMNNIIMLGKTLVDTLKNGNLSDNTEPPLRDELDVIGKFTDYCKSAEGRELIPASKSVIDFNHDPIFAYDNKGKLKTLFQKHGVPKYINELKAKYLNTDDYSPGGKYYEEVLKRITAPADDADKMKEAAKLFNKCLIDAQDPLHENPDLPLAANRKSALTSLIDEFNRAKNIRERQKTLETFARVISQAVLSDFSTFLTENIATMTSVIKPPTTFASVITKTLFNGQDAVNKMMNSLGKLEKGSLGGSLISVGWNELGVKGLFPSFDDVTDKLQKKADQAPDLSFDMEIGF